MPELPEIETIRRDLEATLLQERALRIDVFDSKLLTSKGAAQWGRYVTGQTWLNFGRKGKYLWATLENKWRVVFHMRMTGQLIVSQGRVISQEGKPRLFITFQSGKTLGLYDQRRFAEVWLLSPEQSWHSKNLLGPDALNELQHDEFVNLVKKRTTRIQPLLMDQRLLAGVGNIYAQEALFRAAIRPTRHGHHVTRSEASTLYKALKDILEQAIVHRGTTSRNYRDAYGQEGSAQKLHAVYQKGGEPCPRCRGRLKSIRVGGRGSVFCPQCQR